MEQWKKVSDGYAVSDLGRVKSLERIVNAGPNGGVRTIRERILSAWVCKQTGYLQVCIDRKKQNVHGLVLSAFVGPKPDGFVCAHWDGDRTNATLSNLRWTTYADNAEDMGRHGTKMNGAKNWRSKLTETQVRAIREDKRTRRAIAKEYGVTPEAISHVVLRKNWAWVK